MALIQFVSNAFTVSSCAQDIVINEIHYHPASEDTREEYIELLNTGTSPVDLAGWRFSDGIEFTFPTNIVLPAGGLLVVAADVATFTALHPGVLNVVGNWTGRLSNSDEDLDLDDNLGDRVDSVHYADEGDWAERQVGALDHSYRGWDWAAAHDGGGRSLELINPLMPNDCGQNWRSSLVTHGTPGAVNSVLQSDIAPMVIGAQHLPAIPRSVDEVLVEARLLDEQATGVTASVFWRVDGDPSFTNAPMYDDGLHDDGSSGDGLYAARLPAQPADTVVEFYVQATDGGSHMRTWPAPALDRNGTVLGQAANLLYQVDDSSYAGTLPLYKLIMVEAERADLAAIAAPGSPNRKSRAEMNGTFISADGPDIDVRYLLGFRNRGDGSRHRLPNSYHLSFASDQRWKGVRALNINGQYTHCQIIGSVLSLKSGLACGNSRPVQVRVNNANLGNNGPQTYGGAYAANEVVNSDWTEHWLSSDAAGNAYRVSWTRLGDTEDMFDYRGEDPSAYARLYSKATNASEDDWTDLIDMLRIVGTNDLFSAATVRGAIDVEQWMNYLGVMALLNNQETSPNRGANDDYFLYAGVNDSRFQLVPHDLDTVLGQGDTWGDPAGTIFGSAGEGSHHARSFNISNIMYAPEFEPIYYRALQRLLDTTFSEDEFSATLAQTLGTFVPASVLENMKTWMAARRAYVQPLLTAYLSGLTNAPSVTVSGEPRSPTPLTAATLAIGGEGVVQYRYALNGGTFGIATPVATPLALSGLAHGTTNFVRVVGADTNGTWQAESNATVSASWVVDTAWPAVRINEVLAENLGAYHHAGTFPDAIELYNEGSAPVNLSGMRLSDRLTNPDKFFFPDETLSPGAYRVVSADEAGFSLKKDGEGVFLFDAVSEGGALLDSVEFGMQLPDLSIGRVEGGTFILTQPTFGAANLAQPVATEQDLHLNEWLARGFAVVPYDFVEIYNSGALPAALGRLYLTDNPIADRARHRIAPLSFVAAGGYRLFIADGDTTEGADHLGFKLAGEQGMVALLTEDLATIDCIHYGPQRRDISQGRTPDGDAAFAFFPLPSPGAANPVSTAFLQITTLLDMTNTWRYYQDGSLDGVEWAATTFDDQAWPEGPALLYHGLSALPAPKNTELQRYLDGGPDQVLTYYFRTHFSFAGDPASTVLELTPIVDDGCVVHLNGEAVFWLGYDEGEQPGYGDLAHTTILNASIEGPFSIPAASLVQGDNVLAVEVHQTAANSSDIVLGMQVDIQTVDTSVAVVLNEVLAANRSYTNQGGRISDWVEVMNTGTAEVDLVDLSLSDDPGVPRKWVFPSNSVLAAGTRMLIACDDDLPASTTNTGFALASEGDSVHLYRRLEDGGGELDSLTFGLQAGDFSLSRIPEGWGAWTLGLPTPTSANVSAGTGIDSQLRINEWMAIPEAGSDWFELYNPNAQPVALDDLSLTDDPGDRYKSPFPPLSFIEPKGFTRIVADNQASAGSDHVDFRLDGAGDFIGLYRSIGTQIDGLSFGAQTAGASQGRFLDGEPGIVDFPITASPGAPNYLPVSNLLINELISHTDPPLEDAVEIHNLGSAPVDLGGWYLSDSGKNPSKFLVSPDTVIDGHGFLVFYEYQFASNGLPGVVEPFSFNSAHGGDVHLAQTDASTNLTGYRASARFGAAANGESFGRFVTSLGEEFVTLGERTFGEDTPSTLGVFRSGTGSSNAYPLVGPVVLSEIHFQPTNSYNGDLNAGEFLELRNLSSSPVPLYDPAAVTNTWRVDGGVTFTFPMNVMLPPAGSIIVVGFDPVSDAGRSNWFGAAYLVPAGVSLVGPWSGSLADEGESLQLYRPDAPQLPPQPDAGFVPQVLVERIVYGPSAPWPTNSIGASLQRRVPEGFGNEPLNWFTAVPSCGLDNLVDTDGDRMPDYWELENGLNPNDTNGVHGATGNLDGDPLTNLEEWLAGTRANDALDYLRILSFDLDLGGSSVRFRAAGGRRYDITASDASPLGPWDPVASPPMSANDALMEIEDPTAAGRPVRFYRIEVPAQTSP